MIYCSKCQKRMSATSGYQDKNTLKVLCESCFIDSLFEEKAVVKKNSNKSTETFISSKYH